MRIKWSLLLLIFFGKTEETVDLVTFTEKIFIFRAAIGIT